MPHGRSSRELLIYCLLLYNVGVHAFNLERNDRHGNLRVVRSCQKYNLLLDNGVGEYHIRAKRSNEEEELSSEAPISIQSMLAQRMANLGLSGARRKRLPTKAFQVSPESILSHPPSYNRFGFLIDFQSAQSFARVGRITTPHGIIDTPNFVFCATKGAVKGILPQQLKDAGTQIILGNAYHLSILPGSETVQSLGKLHKFSGWSGPMLTDSGGYQIFSMGYGSVSSEIKGKRGACGSEARQEDCNMISVTEEGASFRSQYDGVMRRLTPESSIKIQRELGADIILVLDECTPFRVTKEYTKDSMERSHRWALRSFAEFMRGDDGSQALYGIIQGGVYEDLRQESCSFVNSLPFFGTAIGGSLGDERSTMHKVVSMTCNMIKRDRPTHLLGIGTVKDIFHGVKQGIDTFDCVRPTRLARHGSALVRPDVLTASGDNRNTKEYMDLSKGIFHNDPSPIDSNCQCYTCQNFCRGYIHHLIKAKETLSGTLVTIHNVYFMNKLMKAIRSAILEGNLEEVEQQWVHETALQDESIIGRWSNCQ